MRVDGGQVDGAQAERLCRALMDAFTLSGLDQLLWFGLGQQREVLSVRGSLADIVFDVVQAYHRWGAIDELVLAARRANPRNPSLVAVATERGLTAVPPERSSVLERLVRREVGFQDIVRWRERLGELEGQIGRVEARLAGGTGFGTAFLVAPDLCLTNYHVLREFIEGADPAGVRVRFDYKRSADGATVAAGTTYELAEDGWLVDCAPPGPADRDSDGLPEPDELDYVVFRLARAAGHEPVGGERAVPQSPARGWLAEPAAEPPAPDHPLLILQHPAAKPLQLAFDTVVGLNGNGTRLRHRVNTEGGSSGSPCFDHALDLVAIHRGGDPDLSREPARYNVAVPIRAIVARARRNGVAGELFPPRRAG